MNQPIRYPFYPGDPAYNREDAEHFEMLAKFAQSESDREKIEAAEKEKNETAETLKSYSVSGISGTKKQLAIALLCAGKPIGQVAAECEISDRQLLRWRHDPDFDRELQRVASAHQARLNDEVMLSVFGAIEAMRELVADSSVSSRDRIAAADVLISAHQHIVMSEKVGKSRRK